MRKHLNINVADLIATLILAAVAALIGYDLGHHGYVHDVYELGFDEGFDAGVERGKYYIESGMYHSCLDGDLTGDICVRLIDQQSAES